MPHDETRRPSYIEAKRAVRTLIAYIGDDPDREGVQDTPDRVLKAWTQDWGTGYQRKSAAELVRTFDNQSLEGGCAYNQMVVVRDISFFSTCEHHMAPFFGVAHLAYIPSALGIVGLSKLARIVEHFSRRLQVQERLTEQLAEFLAAHLSESVGVMMEATHLCMVSRGIRQPHAKTITTALRGDFTDDHSTKTEFLRTCRP